MIGNIFLVLMACLHILTAPVPRGHTVYREEPAMAWKDDFDYISLERGSEAARAWRRMTKPGTPPAVFSVVSDAHGEEKFLHMEADKASATLITGISGVDLKETPVLQWRWRAVTLPEGADGRVGAKDDQAIGIYVGTGDIFNKKTISYRWDTDTPKGTEGKDVYGGGTIKVKWYTLRNKEDAEEGGWYVEKRNIADDFKEAWGFYPEKLYISISCNSQYTRTKAAADLDWIGFAPL